MSEPMSLFRLFIILLVLSAVIGIGLGLGRSGLFFWRRLTGGPFRESFSEKQANADQAAMTPEAKP